MSFKLFLLLYFILALNLNGDTCDYRTSHSSRPINSSANTYNFGIITSASRTCTDGNWTTSSDVSWITLIDGSQSGSGYGEWTINYSVSENPSYTLSRSGDIQITPSFSYHITQAPKELPTCSYYFPQRTISIPSSEGDSLVTLSSTPEDCQNGSWEVSTDTSWISWDGEALSGEGSGSWDIPFTSATNPSSRVRSGSISAGGENITIVQEPSQKCSYTLSSTSVDINASSSQGEFQLSSTPENCVEGSFSFGARPQWISISPSRGSGSGVKTITYSYEENSEEIREGTIDININTNSTIFTIRQDKNRSPDIEPIEIQSRPEGDSPSFAVNLLRGEDITWSLQNSPENVIISSSGIIKWLLPAIVGEYNISVIATNSYGVDNEPFNLIVYGFEPPIISPIPSISGVLTSARFSYKASVEEGRVSILWSLDIPSTELGLTINASSGLISWQEPKVGIHNIGVIATNDDGSDSTTFSIEVEKGEDNESIPAAILYYLLD